MLQSYNLFSRKSCAVSCQGVSSCFDGASAFGKGQPSSRNKNMRKTDAAAFVVVNREPAIVALTAPLNAGLVAKTSPVFAAFFIQ